MLFIENTFVVGGQSGNLVEARTETIVGWKFRHEIRMDQDGIQDDIFLALFKHLYKSEKSPQLSSGVKLRDEAVEIINFTFNR